MKNWSKTYTEPVPFKEELNTLFKAFRANGLRARQNFSCCGGCASYELAVKEEENPSNKIGAVFFTRQDQQRLVENGEGVYLAFGGFEREGEPTEVSTARDRKIGQLVFSLIKFHSQSLGIDADWDGDPMKRIWVS